tara:strand:- start:5516 stop:6997 length:1482 start_codon:yes stop_codon:yes gene_type:complete
MSFSWSGYQTDIFGEVLNTNNNVAIKATAGSGKSTVLVEISKLLPVNSSSIFIAFNKSIVEELSERLPKKFEVSTLHSLGLNILRKNYGKGLSLNQAKTFKMAQKMILSDDTITNHKERNSRIFYVTKGYDYLRSTMTDIDDEEAVQEMLLRFNIDSSYGYHDLKKFKQIADKYNLSRKKGKEFLVDFADMVYLAATLPRLRYPRYENVLVDECQDLNLSQHIIIQKIKDKRKGRVISVGDKHQQIYLFAGSDSASFERFEDAPNTVSLPLSVTYRCPINVVLEAQKYNTEIIAAPNAEYGYVGEGDIDMVGEGDAILCRNNSPLFEAYLELLSEGKKAYIVGKEIAEKFHTLIKPYRNSHVGALINGLRTQLDQIHDNLLAKGIKKPLAHPVYQSFLDISRSLSLIAEMAPNMKQLDARIDEIFCPSKNAVVLSSIHKSKGLEYDRVFLLRPDLLPNKFAKSSEELDQERNLMFVAITRAKKQFFYIRKEDE